MPSLEILVSKENVFFVVVKVHSRMLPLKFYASSNYKWLHGLGSHNPKHSRPRGSVGSGPHDKINLFHGLAVLDRGLSGIPLMLTLETRCI